MAQLAQVLADNNFDNAEIVSSINNDIRIPDIWKQIISAITIGDKKEILSKYWLPMADRLPKTITLINNYLDDAVVIKEAGEYRLVYVFNVDDFLLTYVGHLPTSSGLFLNNMPDDIAAFYQQIHNGWYENISGGLGFLALNQIDWLSSNEWDILDEIPKPNFDLSKVFYVFHNAGAGYLCINIIEPDSPEYLIFWTDKEPKRDIPFWSFIDSWIEIGVTN